MTTQQGLDIKLPDPVQVTQTIATIAQKSQRPVSDFLRRQVADGSLDLESSLNIGKAFLQLTQKMMLEPTRLAQAQMSLWQEYTELWRRSAAAFFGQQVEPVISPAESDRRFKHDDWQENYLFDFIKQAYLLTARWLQNVVSRVENLDPKTKRKIEFITCWAESLFPSICCTGIPIPPACRRKCTAFICAICINAIC